MKRRVKTTETILIFILSYTIVSEGLSIDCSNGTSSTLTPVSVDGEWTTWSSCDVACGEGSTSRRRSCVYSASKSGNRCNIEEDDDESKICERTSNTTFLGTYSEWSPWSMCDFETCVNEPLYDKTRTRRSSCVTSQNGCKYVEESEEVKICKMPKGVLAVFKVANINVTDYDLGWRVATVNDAVEAINETKVAFLNNMKRAENGRPKKMENDWMIAKLKDGSLKGSGYDYEIDRNYTIGWAEILLIQAGIAYGQKDYKWSEWGPCDAICAPQEGLKKIKKDLGYMARQKTCVNSGERNGKGGCRYNNSADVCRGEVNFTFPGAFGTWTNWSPCDVFSCGNSLKDHKVRNRSTCVNYKSDDSCISLLQYEEAKVCEYKEAKIKGLSTKLKIIASCGSWAVLFTVFIISAGSLRNREAERKKAMLLCKNKTKVKREEPPKETKEDRKSTRGKNKKRKKEENEDDVEMSEEKKAETPLLQTMVEAPLLQTMVEEC